MGGGEKRRKLGLRKLLQCFFFYFFFLPNLLSGRGSEEGGVPLVLHGTWS